MASLAAKKKGNQLCYYYYYYYYNFVLSWELSNTMETGFCLAALEAAFRFGQPEIWNLDQAVVPYDDLVTELVEGRRLPSS